MHMNPGPVDYILLIHIVNHQKLNDFNHFLMKSDRIKHETMIIDRIFIAVD